LRRRGMEVGGHLDLVGLVVGDASEGGEVLEGLATRVAGPGRVEDHQVAALELAHAGLAAVIGLCEAGDHTGPLGRALYHTGPLGRARHPAQDMVTRNRVDPVASRHLRSWQR
jgi:hypothetical protein